MVVDWSQLKAMTVARSLSIQWIDLEERYWLVIYDGPFMVECFIHKTAETDAVSLVDFETNFKDAGNVKLQNKDDTGRIGVNPSFEDVLGLTTIWKGGLYTAAPNSLSMFDEVVTSEEKLREGWFKVIGTANIGDYIECSIVDKDNILGYFAMFGLTEGVDVLELKKYIRTEYISPEDKTKQEFRSNAVSELMPGLYLRVAYLNIGDSSVTFTVTKKYHEA